MPTTPTPTNEDTLDPPPSGLLVIFSPGYSAWIATALIKIFAKQKQMIARQDAALMAFGPLTASVEGLMATVAELQTKLDALTAADAENAARTSSEIADLAAALAAIVPGEPVTQAQLDQVQAVVDAMTARNTSLGADDQTPPTP